jgi:hypothetical protein
MLSFTIDVLSIVFSNQDATIGSQKIFGFFPIMSIQLFGCFFRMFGRIIIFHKIHTYIYYNCYNMSKSSRQRFLLSSLPNTRGKVGINQLVGCTRYTCFLYTLHVRGSVPFDVDTARSFYSSYAMCHIAT